MYVHMCTHKYIYLCVYMCYMYKHTHKIEYEIYLAIKSGNPDICDNMSEL